MHQLPNKTNSSTSRRKFIKQLSLSAVAIPFASTGLTACAPNPPKEDLEVHLFSKHLQFLDIKTAAQRAVEMGFSGLDLTVRPKGHILPENVTTELPKAILDMKEVGASCKMIATAVEDATNPLDIDVLKTAGEAGIEYYRCNWFKYPPDISLEASLDYYQKKIQELGVLNKKHNIIGCYQNHSGTKVGASVWEVKKILATVDPAFFGAQYDIRHAVAEGGNSWTNGVKLLQNEIKTIVLKDFVWGQVNGKWKIVNVPIGEGMVDFPTYFKLLKSLELQPPVSLHVEYPLGGAEKGRSDITVNPSVVFEAMKKDLERIQQLWKVA